MKPTSSVGLDVSGLEIQLLDLAFCFSPTLGFAVKPVAGMDRLWCALPCPELQGGKSPP